MYDAGTGRIQVDNFAVLPIQISLDIVYVESIRNPVDAHYNCGFQLTLGRLAADKKSEPELIAVISRFAGCGSQISIVNFAALNMLAVTDQHKKGKKSRQEYDKK